MTLIELMTVIVIICILAVMLFPAATYLRERAEVASCTGNLKGLYVASVSYVTDAQHWPQIDTKQFGTPEYPRLWQEALKKYGIAPINWVCPSAQRLMNSPDLTKPQNLRNDYYATPFDSNPTTPYKWPTQPWFVESGDFHGDGPMMIFSKGDVKSLNQFSREQGSK